MSPSWQAWASEFQVGSLPRPVGSTVAGGMLLFVDVSVLVEVSSVLDDEDDDEEDAELDELPEVEAADVVAAAVEVSSLFRKRISPTAMPARTITPATTRAMTVPLLLFGGCWP